MYEAHVVHKEAFNYVSLVLLGFLLRIILEMEKWQFKERKRISLTSYCDVGFGVCGVQKIRFLT